MKQLKSLGKKKGKHKSRIFSNFNITKNISIIALQTKLWQGSWRVLIIEEPVAVPRLGNIDLLRITGGKRLTALIYVIISGAVLYMVNFPCCFTGFWSLRIRSLQTLPISHPSLQTILDELGVAVGQKRLFVNPRVGWLGSSSKRYSTEGI